MSQATSKHVFRSWIYATLAALFLCTTAYAQETPPDTDKAQQIKALVLKAASLASAKGKAAFQEFHNSGSQWRSGDTYLFGNDVNGMQILNVGFPEREGTDQCCTQDVNGKPIFQEFKRVVEAKGEGWVSYMWPKPGQTQPSQKWSYIKAVKIDGKPAIIGAGFYPE